MTHIFSLIPSELLAPVIGSIAMSIVGFVKGFKFIHEGEKGIKLRFGRALRNSDGSPKIIEPGFVLLIPFVETLLRHHVRQNSFRFDDQRIMLKDGLIFTVGAMILFRVTDIYKALFEIDNLDSSIDDVGMAALREVIQPLNHGDLQDIEEIKKKLIERVKVRTKDWGIEVFEFSLTDCAPTPETANILNAKVGVQMRVEALNEALSKVSAELRSLDPSLAAALVGIPVAVSIGSDGRKTSKPLIPEHKDKPGIEVNLG
ncbi:MAG: SPFH domain-containing protein [Candidatus Paceibacterota bacterium]|jgi:regulator of protease activity HflC (stomatin/prohibitin superfamily)